MTGRNGKPKKNVLLIVEGAKTEPMLLNRAFGAFGLDGDHRIVSVCVNLHELLNVIRRDYQGTSGASTYWRSSVGIFPIAKRN